jgi:hypothetical protein
MLADLIEWAKGAVWAMLLIEAAFWLAVAAVWLWRKRRADE